MNEQNENKVKIGDDIVCPSCGGYQVRWIPYPKFVIRLKQNQRAALVNILHCDTCGTDFEVSKDLFQKGGEAK